MSNLTIAQLKRRLTDHGISPPVGRTRKADLVRLYERAVKDTVAPPSAGRSSTGAASGRAGGPRAGSGSGGSGGGIASRLKWKSPSASPTASSRYSQMPRSVLPPALEEEEEEHSSSRSPIWSRGVTIDEDVSSGEYDPAHDHDDADVRFRFASPVKKSGRVLTMDQQLHLASSSSSSYSSHASPPPRRRGTRASVLSYEEDVSASPQRRYDEVYEGDEAEEDEVSLCDEVTQHTSSATTAASVMGSVVRSVVVGVLLVCVVLLVSGSVSLWNPIYCDTNALSTSNCVTCPAHATCANGTLLSCAPSYVLQRGACVADERLERIHDECVRHGEHFLRLGVGRELCSTSEDIVHVQHSDVTHNLGHFLQQQSLTTDEQQVLLKKVLSSLAQSSTVKRTSDDLWISTDPLFPLQCELRRWFMSALSSAWGNRLQWAPYALVGALVLLWLIRRSVVRSQSIRVSEWALLVKQRLRELRSSRDREWVCVDHMYEWLCDRVGHVSVSDWTRVRLAVSSDKRISESPYELDGDVVNGWKWIAHTH